VEAGGEIVVQDSGGYSTGFTITQSVTIDAAGFNASVISTSGTDLCTINAGPTDRVVLKGISFHGANVGNNAINVMQVGSVYVEHCSISEFLNNGVFMENGGNLFVTGADVRVCNNGINVETTGATTANVVVHESRLTECGTSGVFLESLGSGAVTAVMSDCTAALCQSGFSAVSSGAGNANLRLTNCRAFGNGTGIRVGSIRSGNASSLLANCLVTDNTTGISAFSLSTGTASVLGTSPGTNLISGNGSGNATIGTAVTLQ
jgi:hypothetical protein